MSHPDLREEHYGAIYCKHGINPRACYHCTSYDALAKTVKEASEDLLSKHQNT